jgi:hypothetical protein
MPGAATRRPAPPDAGLSVGARAGIAVALFVAAVAASWAADHWITSMPQDLVVGWYAFAAAAAAVYAITTPWRGAAAAALIAGLLVGGLTYSHPAREKAAAAVESIGSRIGDLLHHDSGGAR